MAPIICFFNIIVDGQQAGPSGRAVYGRSLAAIAGSNPAGGMDVCVMCCTVGTKGKKPGQSGQRSTNRVQRESKKESRRGLGCLFVVCVVI